MDFASDKKKMLYLSTWFIEDSVYGGAGDPSHATGEFGEQLHRMTVENLVTVIEEFYTVQKQKQL